MVCLAASKSRTKTRMRPTYPMQVPDDLVEGGGKGAVNVKEQALRGADAEGLAQVGDDGLELLGGADLADLALELGRRADGLEADNDLVLGEVARAGQGRAGVPRQARQDR